jgi:hypothetical protein
MDKRLRKGLKKKCEKNCCIDSGMGPTMVRALKRNVISNIQRTQSIGVSFLI